ncbi:MAG: TPM domain-containing protein, partial [Chitinophagaceae bacterium]
MNSPTILYLGNKHGIKPLTMTVLNQTKNISFLKVIACIAMLVSSFFYPGTTIQAQVVPHNLLPSKPNPPKLVNDYADLLTPQEESQLERKLVAYDDSTSNQILIVTVKTMRGYEADQYATEIGHYWGVGGQGKYDNGVVILVSDGTEENGKRRYFIATGYGLEGALPAITTNAIAEEFLVPNLKGNNYFAAFDETTNAVFRAAAGEYKAPDNYRKRKSKGTGGGLAGFVVLAIIIFIISRNNRGGGGGFMSRRG